MKKISLFIFLIIFNFCAISEENYTNIFNISFSLETDINELNFPRGISVNWNKYILNNFLWGLSFRILNKDYNYFWGNIGYDFKIKNLLIPINTGIGLKIKNIDLFDDEVNNLTSFVHLQTGIKWQFEKEWSYDLNGIYNYNLMENTNQIFINIGVSYLF